MPTDIFNQLSEISKGRYGADIRNPIHDALAILSDNEISIIDDMTNGEPINSPVVSDYDITGELYIIANNHEGAVVKQAIYDALYKLSRLQKEDRTVVTGLTGIDMSDPIEPSGDDYIYGLSDYYSTWYTTDWETLKEFLEGSSLFSGIEYYTQSDVIKGIDIFVDDEPFFSLRSVIEEIGGETYYYHKASIYNSDEVTTFSYPNNGLLEPINEALVPTEAYRTTDNVVINCLSNAILFSKNSAGGISVTLGCGYEIYPTEPSQTTSVADPSSKILTLTPNFVISDYAGVGHSHSTPASSNVGALTALISEGDNVVSHRGYALTTGYLNTIRADGIVPFGTKQLYIANSMLAMEI